MIEDVHFRTAPATRVRAHRSAPVHAVLVLLPWLLICMTPSHVMGEPAPDRGAELGAHIQQSYRSDLAGILEKKYLRVLTSKNSFDYSIYKGSHTGYQYEMVKSFTDHLNKKYNPRRDQLKIQFELLPVNNDQLIPILLAGNADMIAARLTITPERAEQILFSIPYRNVDEQVLAHADVPAIHSIEDLADRRIAVRRSSSYYSSLVALNQRLESMGRRPLRIELVDEALETEKILELLAAGRYELSVADSIIAETAVALFPGLRILQGLDVRKAGQLAWATPRGAEALLQEIDSFLPKYRHGSLLGNVALKKYFKNIGHARARITANGVKELSSYDEEFRRAGAEFGFDWRLLAAVAYQESRFNQNSRNPSGAVGLFQIKPSTAREPYISIPDVAGSENARSNVRAGTKYLAWIKKRYFDPIPVMRERDRIRLTLAAYNAGPRTLINARRRAESMGLDPNRWFRNVEMALMAAKRIEPVKYVSEINQHYLSYVMLGIE